MVYTVSVDEAIKRGQRMIGTPVVIIMMTMVIGSAALMVVFDSPIPLLGMLAGFLAAWLYWSKMIVKWRIWALENVRNVHELKARAIKEKLIWKDNSFFEKTEIRTATEKLKLAALQDRFKSADVFTDDFSIPAETEIHYSKNKTLGEIIVGVVMICGSSYFFIEQDTHLLGAVLIVAGLCITFFAFRKYRNRSPRIILNSKGIQTADIPFYEWDKISNEDVIAVQTGKTRSFYFVYDNPSGIKRLNIGDLEVNRQKLESLLRVYRGRNNKSIANH